MVNASLLYSFRITLRIGAQANALAQMVKLQQVFFPALIEDLQQ